MTDDGITGQPNGETLTKIEVQSGILKFSGKKQLNALLTDANNNTDKNYLNAKIAVAVQNSLTGGNGSRKVNTTTLPSFTSYDATYHYLDSLANADEAKFNLVKANYSDINCDDVVSEDVNFAKVINSDKEIIVGDTLYRIDNDGVLTVGKKDINNYISKAKESKLLGKKLDYKTVQGASFFTNKELKHISTVSYQSTTTPNARKTNATETSSDGVDPATDITYIGYDNERQYKDFPIRKRRLKVLFWSRDWIAYKTVGVKVVVQKQTSSWFNWWGSVENHDYVKAHLSNFAYRINQKDFFTPPSVYNTTPSFGTVGAKLVSKAAKIVLKNGIEYYSFDLKDLINYGVVTDALGIPSNWIKSDDIMNLLLKSADNATNKKIFKALDAVLPATFQEKRYLAIHYVPTISTATVGPTLFIKDTEFASYGSGIIDETLIKAWQGILISWGSNSGFGAKPLDVSDVEILPGTQVIGVGSLNGYKVGISLKK